MEKVLSYQHGGTTGQVLAKASDVDGDVEWVEQSGTSYDDTEIRGIISNKVDKVSGKGLSTKDFTDAYETKLSGIATGANKTTVENNVTSTSATNALSAAQGKALNDKMNGVTLYKNEAGTVGTVTLRTEHTRRGKDRNNIL